MAIGRKWEDQVPNSQSSGDRAISQNKNPAQEEADRRAKYRYNGSVNTDEPIGSTENLNKCVCITKV